MSQEGQASRAALQSPVPDTNQPPPPTEHKGNQMTPLSPAPSESP